MKKILDKRKIVCIPCSRLRNYGYPFEKYLNLQLYEEKVSVDLVRNTVCAKCQMNSYIPLGKKIAMLEVNIKSY